MALTTKPERFVMDAKGKEPLRAETLDDLIMKMKAADEILEAIRFDVSSEAREKVVEMRTKWHRQTIELLNEEFDRIKKFGKNNQ